MRVRGIGCCGRRVEESGIHMLRGSEDRADDEPCGSQALAGGLRHHGVHRRFRAPPITEKVVDAAWGV